MSLGRDPVPSSRRVSLSLQQALWDIAVSAPQTLAKGKIISTDHLKLFLSRRKWQVKAGAGEGVG